MTTQPRTAWSIAASIVTFLVPAFVLKLLLGATTPAQQRAWREKVLLFLIFLLASAAFGVAMESGRSYFCSQPLMFTQESLTLLPHLATANGLVVDIGRFNDPNKTQALGPLHGLDLSGIFPMAAMLGRVYNNATKLYYYPDTDIATCVGSRVNNAEKWLSVRLNDTGYRRDGLKLVGCPLPVGYVAAGNVTNTTCFYTQADRAELAEAAVADLGVSRAKVAERADVAGSNALVIVRNKVYDVGRFLNISTDAGRPKNDTSFLSDSVTLALLNAVGGDATSAVTSLSDGEDAIKCMDKLFLAGFVQETPWQGCALINPVWYVVTGAVVLALLAKILLGHLGGLFGAFSCCLAPLSSEANVLMVVSVYAEPEEVLQECFAALASTKYSDGKKMLCVVCDGNVLVADSSSIESHRAVLDILGYRGGEPRPRSYRSLGEGPKAYNEAKVYSGTYTLDKHQVDYVVIAKMGTKYELERSGNRGKRDTHLMLLQFLNKVRHSDSLLGPLEWELQHRLTTKLGYDPRAFEYMLTVDGNTVVERDSVATMVRMMDASSRTVILVGETRLGNATHGPATILQAYPEYFRRQPGQHFDSMTGLLTNPSGNFALQRLKYYDGSACLLNGDLISDYAAQYTGTRPSMHMLNVLYMGEDRHFAQVVRRHIEKCRIESTAAARATARLPTGVAAAWATQRQQWNATFHNKWEVVRAGGGAFSLWTRLWALVEVVSMLLLPAAVAYMYYVIVQHALSPYTLSSAVVGYAADTLALLNLALLLLSGQFSFLLIIPVFLIVGVPLFYIILPCAAFWTSDSVSWAATHRAELDRTSHTHGCIASGSADHHEKAHVPVYTAADWQQGDVEAMAAATRQDLNSPTFALSFNNDSSFKPAAVAAEKQAQYDGNDNHDDYQRRQHENNNDQLQQQFTAPHIDNHQRPQHNFDDDSEYVDEPPAYAVPSNLMTSMDRVTETLPPPLVTAYGSPANQFSRPYSMAPTETDLRLDSGHLSRPESLMSHMDARRSVLPPSLAQPASRLQQQQHQAVPQYQQRIQLQQQHYSNNNNTDNNHQGPSATAANVATTAPAVEMRPTNFEEAKRPVPRKNQRQISRLVSEEGDDQRMSFSPMRAQSMARSDYMSDYSPSFNADRSSRRSAATVGSMYGNLDDESLVEMAGGLTKDEIRTEIRFLLRDADLNTITRREVKEHLYVQFGEAVDVYHDFINICIEEYTLEKLALL